MKYIKKIKRIIGKYLFVCMVFNSVMPTVLAMQEVGAQKIRSEYIEAEENGVAVLINEMVQKAISLDMDGAFSNAFVRCYQRIAGGYKTLLVEDVMQAMPELLNYAINQCERPSSDATMRSGRSPRPDASHEWEQMESFKAPRPGAEGDVVGPILSDPIHNVCGIDQVDVKKILKCLQIIKKRIGTVRDDVCWNSILGILGDACEKFGPDSNISCEIVKLCDKIIENREIICEKFEEQDELICDKFEEQTEIICEKFEDIKVTLTECCEDILVEIEDTRTILCKKIEDQTEVICDKFEEQDKLICDKFEDQTEVICDKFEQTWTILEDIDEDLCCTRLILCEKIEEVKEILCECCSTLDCKLGKFNDCTDFPGCECDCDPCDDCDIWSDDCDLCCKKVTRQFPGNFDNVSDGLNKIFCKIQDTSTTLCDKFEQTWTILEEIDQDIFDTRTILCEKIEDQTEIICDKFEQTWTILEDIKETLTECCDDLADDIFDTQTILCEKIEDLTETLTECCDDLADDIFDTQTILCEKIEDLNDTLTECCEEILMEIEDTQTILCDKFEQTWTILEDIKETLTECCEDILMEIEDTQTILCDKFEQTWTILEDISDSTTILCQKIEDLNDTLTECCEDILMEIEDTQTILCDKFEQTWTILQDIDIDIVDTRTILCEKIEDLNDTLTECCEDILMEIEDTRTILCDKFEQTWTILQDIDADIFDTRTILCDKIEDLNDTLTECCQDLADDIFDTQTILCQKIEDLDLSVTVEIDLTGVFTELAVLSETLTECCQDLEDDIENSLTILCDKFEQTWTILADIDQDIFDTQTILCQKIEDLDLSVTVEVDLTGVFTVLEDLNETLTECCQDLADDILDTRTIICDKLDCLINIPITEPITISVPGVYCLVNDIVGQILITTSNVVILGGDHCITTGGTTGIEISAGVANVEISNLCVRAVVTAEGIKVNSGCSNITLRDITVRGCGSAAARFGINFLGTAGSKIRSCLLERVDIIGCRSGLKLEHCDNVRVSLVRALDLDNPDGDAEGFAVVGVSGTLAQCNTFANCSAQNITGIGVTYGFSFLFNAVTVADFCTADAIVNANSSQSAGFFVKNCDNGTVLSNCVATNISSNAAAEGFLVEDSNDIVIRYCQAFTIAATTAERGDCFRVVDSTSVVLRENESYDSDCDGIHIETSDCVYALNCVSCNHPDDCFRSSSSDRTNFAFCRASNCGDDGFKIDGDTNSCVLDSTASNCGTSGVGAGFHLEPGSANCIIGRCKAIGNNAGANDVGFDNASGNLTNVFTDCFASDNTTNYSLVVNVALLGVAVTLGVNIDA